MEIGNWAFPVSTQWDYKHAPRCHGSQMCGQWCHLESGTPLTEVAWLCTNYIYLPCPNGFFTGCLICSFLQCSCVGPHWVMTFCWWNLILAWENTGKEFRLCRGKSRGRLGEDGVGDGVCMVLLLKVEAGASRCTQAPGWEVALQVLPRLFDYDFFSQEETLFFVKFHWQSFHHFQRGWVLFIYVAAVNQAWGDRKNHGAPRNNEGARRLPVCACQGAPSEAHDKWRVLSGFAVRRWCGCGRPCLFFCLFACLF